MAYTEDFTSDSFSKERVYPYKDNEIRARRVDPYGFIYFSLKRGELPEMLANKAFTTFDEADKQVKVFLESIEREEAEKRAYRKNPQ